MPALKPQRSNLIGLGLRQFAVAALYLLFGLLIERYNLDNGIASIVWPGSGLALAALLVGGKRYIWGVLLGSLALRALTNDSLLAIGGITLANVLQARVGLWLLTRNGQPALLLDCPSTYFRLLALGALSCLVGAILGPLSLLLTGSIPAAELARSMLIWWMGDALGVVLITPLIVAWWQEKKTTLTRKTWLESMLLIGLTALAGQLVFLDWFNHPLSDTPKGYLLFLCISLVAIRIDLRVTTLAVVIVAVQALAGAYQKIGFFAHDIARASLGNYWAYMLILAVVGMVIATHSKSNKMALAALSLKDRALNVAANSIVITDTTGRIEWANHEFSRVTGYQSAEFLGHNARALVRSGVHDQAYYRSMWETILTGAVWRGEIVNRRKDGSLFDEEMTITPMLDEGREIAHFVAVKQNISARKQAERQEQYRSRVLELLAGDVALADILDAIVRGAQEINPAMLCSILLLDSEGRHLGQTVAPGLPAFYNAAVDGIEIGPGVGSCGSAAFTGKRVIVEDIQTHPFWTPYKALAASAGLGACWSQPILSSQNQVLGTFAIYHREPHTPTPPDIALIEQSARLASIAIERKRAEQRLRESEARMRLIFDNTLDAVVGMDLDGIITDWNARAETLFGWSQEEARGRALDATIIPEQHRQAHRQGLARFIATGETRMLGRRITITALRRNGDEFPIELAVMRLQSGDSYQFTAFIADITERQRVEDLVRQLAFYDPLTTLPNRRLLSDRLSQIMSATKRHGHYGALIFLDLDNFKPLNDTRGHAVGDLLLVEAANRLKKCVREMDTVARFGGDEFVVLLSDLGQDQTASTAQAGVVAEKIRTALLAPYVLTASQYGAANEVFEHHCSASIGVVVFIDDHTGDDDLLKWADAAMYQAKNAGRNAIRFYAAPA